MTMVAAILFGEGGNIIIRAAQVWLDLGNNTSTNICLQEIQAGSDQILKYENDVSDIEVSGLRCTLSSDDR